MGNRQLLMDNMILANITRFMVVNVQYTNAYIDIFVHMFQFPVHIYHYLPVHFHSSSPIAF